MRAFDYNELFTKAQLYVERAHEEERGGDLYPFWVALSLELLIRSTLAKIHPALLAETPNSNDHKSLLYAFGYDLTGQPKTISISNAINRLGDIIPEFTAPLRSQALLIVNERNTELHSALKGFEEFPAAAWISDYYRISNILLVFQGLTLDDLFGRAEAKAAAIMIQDYDVKLRKSVLDKIQAYKNVFQDLAPEEVEKRLENSERELRKFSRHTTRVKCPCCEHDALLTGEQVSISSAKVDGGELKEEIRYLPSKLACFACGLKIDGYPQLKIVHLGNVFTTNDYLDPVEYLGIEPEQYINIDELVERRMREHYDTMDYMDE